MRSAGLGGDVDAGKGGGEGDSGKEMEDVRLDSLVQKDRRDASVFGTGEVPRESSEPGVDAPEPGEPGRLSSMPTVKLAERGLHPLPPLCIGIDMGVVTLI